MATQKSEMLTVWNDIIRELYPDQTSLDASINLVAWTAVDAGDVMAYAIAKTFVNIRGPQSLGWTQTMTTAQKNALYVELSQVFLILKTVVDSVQVALAAALAALP